LAKDLTIFSSILRALGSKVSGVSGREFPAEVDGPVNDGVIKRRELTEP